MEVLDKNPTETYITYDYDLNTVSGWSNQRWTVDAWLKQFSEYCQLKKFEGERNITLINVPILEFRKASDLKRKRKNLTDEQRKSMGARLAASRSIS